MSCLRGAQLQAQNIKEISIMLGLTIHITADDISKRLSFLILAGIVMDAHFNKGFFLHIVFGGPIGSPCCYPLVVAM